MVSYYTDRDTGKSYAHSEDVTDTTFAEFLSDERSRGHDVVAGIAAAPDDDDDTRTVSRAVSATVSPNLTTQEIMAQTQLEQEEANRRWEADRRRADALRQENLRDEARVVKQRQAATLQHAIDNAVSRPTTAIYARYLAGTMSELEVLGAIEEEIAARLERMGIPTGYAPTVPGTGGVRVGSGQRGAGEISFESGSDLVIRMAQAELEQLRSRFVGFIPQPNQGRGESDNETNVAGYQAWQARLIAGGDIAPLPGAISTETFVPATDAGTVVKKDAVDTRTDREKQADLNRERRLREPTQLPWAPALPVPDPGAIIGPGGLLSRQQLIEEQDPRGLFLRGLQEATGRGLGGFIPVAQRAISRAFSRFGDVSPITNYFPQQERGASWRDYLKGPQPTAESLQTSLGNILGDFANRPSNISPAFAKFSTTFGTPESAISAAAQPYLTKIAPRLRGAAQTGIFNMFGPQFAANPQQYQTPEQIFGVFKDFQSRGF
jgi:hypothetical protein